MNTEGNDCIRSKIIESLRNELPVLRAKVRVSQKEIAERIGISRQTYSLIETGKRDMSWTTFLALTAFFQNNDSTKKMLGEIDGFGEGLDMIIDLENGMHDR